MKRDIENRADIELLMRGFYDKLLSDTAMQHIFLEVAQLDLEAHFPRLVDFWDSILFFTATYRDNAMLKHLELHQKVALKPHHFATWLQFFDETVDELFEGEKAKLAKDRAHSIAGLMQIKVGQLNN